MQTASTFRSLLIANPTACNPKLQNWILDTTVSLSRKRSLLKCNSSVNEGIKLETEPSAPTQSIASGDYGERLVIGENSTEDDGMSIKLECDESGCVLIVGQKLQTLQDDNSSKGYLRCDINGCFYGAEPPEQEFKVLEGAGWRLGYETAPQSEESFSAMVGAGGWSVALTTAEFNDFTKLIQMLRRGIITMDEDGVIGRDEIVLQVEMGNIWMECKLPKKRLPSLQKFLKFGGWKEASAFEIRFILGGKSDRRQAEGYWPAEAVLDMLQKVDQNLKSVADESARPLPTESAVTTVAHS